jgi:alpha-ketoglutaric semialdehyde dehydrogenase
MQLTGRNLIGRDERDGGGAAFRGTNPATGAALEPAFQEATPDMVDEALRRASAAFERYRQVEPGARAGLLRGIAEQIEALGDELIERAGAETGLPAARLTGERGRTVGQLRLFAEVVEDGSWVEARIDTARPDRAPLPKPDVRRMLIPIGPVAVFGASNFPLAFSVAGGDTASALAAGCPVVFKAHPAHPGTSELVGRAVLHAVEAAGLPDGVFSLLHGWSHEVGLALVRHPRTRAVGFTGSLRGGRALFDAAAARPEPIPVYAEMGSVNPVFLLPEALRERAERVAEGMAQSITLGVGQFCTNPGLIVGVRGEALQRFTEALAEHIRGAPAGSMLYGGMQQGFQRGVEALRGSAGVQLLAESSAVASPERTEGAPVVFATSAATFLDDPHLQEEVFGPSSLVVAAESEEELVAVARALEGQLTATVHATEHELPRHRGLVDALAQRAGRVILNGFPTGVEVCHSMHHGGPYPATTDARTTSVGTAAIGRFARPVSFQGFPREALPPELRDDNPRGIWRMVDGQLSREPLGRGA